MSFYAIKEDGEGYQVFVGLGPKNINPGLFTLRISKLEYSWIFINYSVL